MNGTRLCCVTVAVAILAPGCGERPPPAKVPATPRQHVAQIHFPDVERELGDVAVSPEDRTVEFSFENRGTAQLEIKELISHCGCADVDVTDYVIAPGQTARAIMSIRTQQAEERSATATVVCNDPRQPRTRLTARWRAVAPLEFAPLSLDFGMVLPNQSTARTIALRRNAGPPVADSRVQRIECSPGDRLRAILGNSASAADAVSESIEVLLSSGERRGANAGRVVAYLQDAWTDSISLPVRWEVHDVIEAVPSALFLGAGSAGRSFTTRIVVSSPPGINLLVDAATLAGAWKDGDARATRLGSNRYLIEVRCALPTAPGVHKGDCVVACSIPEVRELRIPVSGYVRSASGAQHGGNDE